MPKFFRRWFPRKSPAPRKSPLQSRPGSTLVVTADFDTLLTEADKLLRTFHSGSDPHQHATRQLAVHNAFCTAMKAAATTQQLCRAHLAVSSAYLIFARAGKDSRQRQVSLELALHHIAMAESRQASISAVESLAEEYLVLAAALGLPLSLDFNAALSFWARAFRAAGSPSCLQISLRVGQLDWLLEHLDKGMKNEDYKTALACTHEGIIAVEAVIDLARKERDHEAVQVLQEALENVRGIECYVHATQVAPISFWNSIRNCRMCRCNFPSLAMHTL